MNKLPKFVEEFAKRSKIIYGENNAPEYTLESLGDPRVGFFLN